MRITLALLLSIFIIGCNYTQTDYIFTVKDDCGTDYVRTIPGTLNQFVGIDICGNIIYYTIGTYNTIVCKEILFSLDGLNYETNSPHFISISNNNDKVLISETKELERK